MKKTIASLLTMTLLFTLTSAYLPSTVTALTDLGTISWVTLYTGPWQIDYWDNVILAYEAEMLAKGYTIDIVFEATEWDMIYDSTLVRHTAGTDADIIGITGYWVPGFANWKTEILAVPPDWVQADVRANWTQATVDAATYKSIVWGYPSEFNSFALVYNRYLFETEITERGAGTPEGILLTNVLAKLEADTPLSHTEFKDAAKLLTHWDPATGLQTQAGFTPYIDDAETNRFQFLSLLWSNGGEFRDLSVPEALFNDPSGYEVMEIYRDLGYTDLDPMPGVQSVYDPLLLPDYYWDAWADETLAMMIMPPWFWMLRDAMPGYFGHLGVAPIPVGPSGTDPISATYIWINVVTQKSVDDLKGDAVWAFLKWVNEPKPALSIPMPGAPEQGNVPKGDNCSIMGDFLIDNMIIPPRITDQLYGRLTVHPGGTAGNYIKDDFWFAGFTKFGSPPYGKAPKDHENAEKEQDEIGLMWQKVTIGDADPITAVNDAAAAVDNILPMAGDINLNGPVSISDAVLLIGDWGATPGTNWNRGRSDVNDDGKAGIIDAVIIVLNWGKVGG